MLLSVAKAVDRHLRAASRFNPQQVRVEGRFLVEVPELFCRLQGVSDLRDLAFDLPRSASDNTTILEIIGRSLEALELKTLEIEARGPLPPLQRVRASSLKLTGIHPKKLPATLPPLDDLEVATAPGYHLESEHIERLVSALGERAPLRELRLREVDQFRVDLTPLERLESVRTLSIRFISAQISGEPRLIQFDPLRRMNIASLSVGCDVPLDKLLLAFAALPLEQLRLSGSPISRWGRIKGSLEKLPATLKLLYMKTPAKDMSAEIVDAGALGALHALEHLTVRGFHFDHGTLASLPPSAESVSVAVYATSDLQSVLAGLPARLRSLNLTMSDFSGEDRRTFKFRLLRGSAGRGGAEASVVLDAPASYGAALGISDWIRGDHTMRL